jgi:hypothetical protein
MKRFACTASHASRTRASGIDSSPRRRLSSTVPAKRNTSWWTMATLPRRPCSAYSRTSRSSTSTVPRVTSQKRETRLTMVVLPAPVCPTIAIIRPGSMTNERSRSTGSPSTYSKPTSRSSTRPSSRPGRTASGRSSISLRSSRMVKIRSAAVIARWMRSNFSVRSRMGWKNISAKRRNARIVPTEIAPTAAAAFGSSPTPRSTSPPPNHSTSPIAAALSVVFTGRKTAQAFR